MLSEVEASPIYNTNSSINEQTKRLKNSSYGCEYYGRKKSKAI